MSLIKGSRQLPDTENTDRVTLEEDPTPEHAPGDTGGGGDAAAGDTASGAHGGVREEAGEDSAGDGGQDGGGVGAAGDEAAASDTGGKEAARAATTEAVLGPDHPERPATDGGWRARYPDAARAVSWGTTALAAALPLLALLLPNQLTHLTPDAFVCVPVEGILVAAALLVLPPRARRVVAVLTGVGLGLLAILKFLDMGFYSVLERPFDLMLDWGLFADAESALSDSAGHSGAIAAVIGVVLLVLALLVLMPLAVLRLSNVMVRHRERAIRTTLVFGTVWITCAALGVEVAAGVPVASRSATALVEARAHQVRADLKDEQAFAKAAAHDDFAGTPADQLLTGLRGKDVIFTFIESYGRGAVEDPGMAPGVDAVLTGGTAQLHAAGFSARSGWLTSSTFAGGSWLAHSTFMSGLWIKDQQRYRTVTSSSRMSLTDAFKRTGAWRTVGIMPGVTRAWPEARFYGLDHVYDSRHLGYQGPKFSWSTMPDQYTLTSFERLEHGRPGNKPLMSEIILTSSHEPWAPIPETISWDKVGDGSVYNAIKKAGKDPQEVWKNSAQVRAEYARSIEYSLNSLLSFVEKYGNKNTVLVFLGDHQPMSIVSGENASREVPVAIVAHDPAVLDRISGWGWTDGIKPAANAPVWRMDAFRDRFLAAYGPHSASTASPATR